MDTNINGNGVLIRKGTSAILPISDAQYIQYHNSNLTTTLPNIGTVAVENVKDGLDALYNEITNASPMTEITYADLVTAKTNGTLNPGSWYRITDYVTTTSQTDTQSANHPFDVIVLATSTNTLSEEARAIQHSGDTYFANSNLNAWKVWYCLENDSSRFAWADDSVDESTEESITADFYGIAVRSSQEDIENKYAWDDDIFILYTNSATPNIGDSVYLWDEQFEEFRDSSHHVTSFTPAHEGTGLPNGRGVIYRLIDEFNNDIKYDFKNIQFKRTITNGQYDANGDDTWCYTLNVWYNNKCQDASIVGNTLPNDEGYINGVYDNVFGYDTAYDLYIEGDTFAFALGNNVILSFDENGEYYGIFSNTIGNYFYSNTIGNDFSGNTIGFSFVRNTIGNSFYGNTIGHDFSGNTIGNYFYSNTIGNDFSGNTIGNNFYANTIGNSFYSNTIGNEFNDNTIGNYFYANTIGNYFYANTIGNYFYANTIGNLKDYVRYIRVEEGVEFVDITTSATTSANAYLQNITIAQGVSGTSSTRKVITHPTANDNFQTIYKPANSRTVSV